MPRFSDRERAFIRTKLREVGAELFAAHGLAKVSVADLAVAAGIAKGSFYAFYGMKEELYLDILGELQVNMVSAIEAVLARSTGSSRQRLAAVCTELMAAAERAPLLVRTDPATLEQLYRRLPPEALAGHTDQDAAGVARLVAAGISLACTPVVAAKVLQQVFIAAWHLPADDPDRAAVLDRLIAGVAAGLTLDD
ncbi:MAG: hypothetical protein A2Z99_02115 [Treponema sp. GWB1_62_6]|nr:MAG: hypothetical protein A2Y36_04650 [Treponema sp. GWA1_62_8]OHE65298.1 MAG: hypothetical protein A2001_03565 [Treponema sp. GWC1_61_84]OHE69673.1 MAG: hypothetical protein A2Z99_02115 [Treponema sp. GWB1_62_6]HCM28910.1 hypothetical protein [Treponema sp.]